MGTSFCAWSPHLPWTCPRRTGHLLPWVCVRGAGTGQITSPYRHNQMGDVFLISLCWLLHIFLNLHLDQWQIFWEDSWGRCQQTGALLHNSLYVSCFLDEESCCVKTSIQQAFSTHCICCFSSFFCFAAVSLNYRRKPPPFLKVLKSPSCHLRFFIPFHWVGCQNWLVIRYCNVQSLSWSPCGLPSRDQASEGQRTSWTQTCLQNLNAELLWEHCGQPHRFSSSLKTP